jgi:hypothetical protein
VFKAKKEEERKEISTSFTDSVSLEVGEGEREKRRCLLDGAASLLVVVAVDSLLGT